MSICSAMSEMSVSYGGEEVPLDQALENCFLRIQTFINETHCAVRTLAIIPEQDNDYVAALDVYHNIIESINGMIDLISEFKSISKDVLGKCPKELKQEVAAKVLAFKQRQYMLKMLNKGEKANKENKMLDEVKE